MDTATIVCKCKSGWNPPRSEEKPPRSSTDTPYLPSRLITFALGEELTAIVADAVNRHPHDRRGSPLKPEKVLVDFQEMHPHAFNVPDIAIHIALGWRKVLEDQKVDVQAYIRRSIRIFLEIGINALPGPRPSFRLDLEFTHNSGCSVDAEGQVVDRW